MSFRIFQKPHFLHFPVGKGGMCALEFEYAIFQVHVRVNKIWLTHRLIFEI